MRKEREIITIRVYLSHPVPLKNLSLEKKRELLLMERRNVDRVVIAEALKLLTLYTNEVEETVRYDDCFIEMMDGEPEDALSDGLSLLY